MGELGLVHRHEKSGQLHGLMRVRCFTQDDAHKMCIRDRDMDLDIWIVEFFKKNAAYCSNQAENYKNMVKELTAYFRKLH